MKLTNLEVIAVKAFWASSKANGHDFGCTEDISQTEIDSKSRPGVIASLAKKNIIDVQPPENFGGNSITQFVFLPEGRSLFADFDTSDLLA